jgi:glutaredoxin 3
MTESNPTSTTTTSPPVRMYTTKVCPYCVRAKMLLNKRAIPFEEIDVSADPDKRAWLVKASGGLRTVPVIFIHGESIGGSDELHALDRAGRLMAMVAGVEGVAGEGGEA